jgi:transcriptional regulator with XRE-family HTH domain
MKDRIKQIRTNSGLNQSDFGKKISISRSAVWKIENGENTPSEQTINIICREFNVNENWLRTGTGDMYKLIPNKLELYLGEISNGDDDFIKDLIEAYMELDQTSKDALKQIAKKMADKQKKREFE